MQWNRKAGFTLIELLVVVGIIAVLAAIAYPLYSKYVLRTRRSDAKEFLMRLAAAEERYFTNCNQYATAITGTVTACGGTLGFSSATSSNGYYLVGAPTGTGANNQTFVLTATPQGAQTADASDCTTLTIDNTGTKGYSGAQSNGNCW